MERNSIMPRRGPTLGDPTDFSYRINKVTKIVDGDKISAEEKKAIEDAKAEVETALKSDDAEKIKTAVGNLTNASMKLGEAVYKQAQQEQAQPESKESNTESDDKVVDAEFEEVKKEDDDKK